MSEGTNLRWSEGALDKDLQKSPLERYTLRLYISGATAASGRAIERVKSLCEARLSGRYDLEVVDIHQPDLVDDDRILATPTLVRRLPLPFRRLVGDLSDPDRILMRLDLHPAA